MLKARMGWAALFIDEIVHFDKRSSVVELRNVNVYGRIYQLLRTRH